MLLLVGFVFAETSWLYSVRNQKENSVNVGFRKKVMDNIFSQAKINWDNDGLFVFREKGDSLRLVVLNKNSEATLFQKPSQKESRILHPDAYLKERESLSNYKNFEKCMDKFTIDSATYNALNELPLTKYPVVTPAKADSIHAFHNTYSMKQKPLYLGYKKDDDKIQYFAFWDFRIESETLSYPLNALEEVPKTLQNLFSREAPKCE